jgi:hypothetical protein
MLLIPALLLAQTAAVEITAEPHHHLVLTNDQVRVFKVEVAAGSATLMHWHRHDYIYVTLGATELSNEVEGKPSATLKLADGETRFSPGPFAHLVRTVSDQPFRNVTVELLQDEKLRHAPAHPEEDRGLNILAGGTEEILFVQDGVRASEFELQPNGAVPSRPRSRPLLLVAVNDLDLYTEDPRTHGGHEPMPKPSHLNAGDCTWLAGGFRRPLVNAGRNNARFVTLEFP